MAFAVLFLLASGALAYRSVDACRGWQERYKRFLYSEMMKNSPVTYSPEMIEEVVGERPGGCDRPSRVLSKADVERYRQEGVGPNEFVEERRAAYRRTEDS